MAVRPLHSVEKIANSPILLPVFLASIDEIISCFISILNHAEVSRRLFKTTTYLVINYIK